MNEVPVEILLVEDSVSDEELTIYALRAQNLANDIVVVHDGAEGLRLIFDIAGDPGSIGISVPKLIILDLKLPKVDGLEVLRQIKGDPRTRSIPVVVLTSSREERDIVESYKLGVNSYICKPVDFGQFTDAVKQIGLYWLRLNEPPAA